MQDQEHIQDILNEISSSNQIACRNGLKKLENSISNGVSKTLAFYSWVIFYFRSRLTHSTTFRIIKDKNFSNSC